MKKIFAAAFVVAALVLTACGSSSEKPAETPAEPAGVQATAPDSPAMEPADTIVRDTASTRPVGTPNKGTQRSIPPKPADQ